MHDIGLRDILEGISDSYEDFVEGVLDIVAASPEAENAIREFISGREKVTTSDIIEYIDDTLIP